MNTILLEIFIAFILIDLFLLFFIIWSKKQKSKKFNHIFYKTEWKSIMEIKKNSPESAVMSADKLLDKALQDLGYTGTFAEKLKPAQNLLKAPEPLWKAHKMRNHIAHTAGHRTTAHDANTALAAYRKALLDFGVQL